jgi:Spy/CpxP family protein refolding chaperone
MNPTTQRRIRTLAVIALGALVMSPSGTWAERDDSGKRHAQGEGGKGGSGGQGHEERTAFHKAQHEKVKSFRESQNEKRKAAHEAARAEEDPYAVVTALKTGQEQNNAEAVAFGEQMHSEAIAFLDSMVSKYEMPEEKQTEIKTGIEERYSDRKERRVERYEKMNSVLSALSAKNDLTKKDIKEAIQSLRKSGGKRGGEGKEGHGKTRGRRRDKNTAGKPGADA